LVQPRWKAQVDLATDGSSAILSNLSLLRYPGTPEEKTVATGFDDKDWVTLGPFLKEIERVLGSFDQGRLEASETHCGANFFSSKSNVAAAHFIGAKWYLGRAANSALGRASGDEENNFQNRQKMLQNGRDLGTTPWVGPSPKDMTWIKILPV
jgi:hypothetical protein